MLWFIFPNFCFPRDSSFKFSKAAFVWWFDTKPLREIITVATIPFHFGAFSMQEPGIPTCFLCDHFNCVVMILLPQLRLPVHAFLNHALPFWVMVPPPLPKWLWTLLLSRWYCDVIPRSQHLGVLLADSHQPLWIA